MNVIKFVPANPKARAADRTAVLKIKLRKHGETTMELSRMAAHKGWMRLRDLKPAEKRLYRGH